MSGKEQILYYKELDSTNLEAKRLAKQGADHGTVVVAERQSAGRGRLGRAWNSPAGSNIYMTLLLRPRLQPELAPMLTLVMACSVADALRQVTGLEAQIKWPHDIVLGGKKVCGILTEMEAEPQQIHHVVIGVGINVNTEQFSEEIQETATSLYLASGKTFSREAILAEVLTHFEKEYAIFMRDRNLSGLREHYNALLVNRGREVLILDEKETYQAVAFGINEWGELLVRKEDGSEEAVFAGEVSVRGIYGYV